MQTKKSFLNSKGFYIAIILSVVTVTVATYVAINMTVNNITDQAKVEENIKENTKEFEEQANAEDESPTYDANNNVTNVPAVDDANKNSVSSSMPESKPKTDDTKPVVPKSTKLILPLKGNAINPYSNGEMVKSVTLNEWRTHDGVDLMSEVGTPVKSAGAGTVKSSYKDPMWGNCVVISHPNEIETHYYNLDSNVLVSKGQTVKLGDVIGNIGTSADIEAAIEPHLHFAVKQNDQWINPDEVISKTKD